MVRKKIIIFVLILCVFFVSLTNYNKKAQAIIPEVAVLAYPPAAIVAGVLLLGAAICWGVYNTIEGDVYTSFTNWLDSSGDTVTTQDIKDTIENELLDDGLITTAIGEYAEYNGTYYAPNAYHMSYSSGCASVPKSSIYYDILVAGGGFFVNETTGGMNYIKNVQICSSSASGLEANFDFWTVMEYIPSEDEEIFDKYTNPNNTEYDSAYAEEAVASMGITADDVDMTTTPPVGVDLGDITDMGTIEGVYGDNCAILSDGTIVEFPHVAALVATVPDIPQTANDDTSIYIGASTGQMIVASPTVEALLGGNAANGDIVMTGAAAGTVDIVDSVTGEITTVYNPTLRDVIEQILEGEDITTTVVEATVEATLDIPMTETATGEEAVLTETEVDEEALEEAEIDFDNSIPLFDSTIDMPEKMDIPLSDWRALVPFTDELGGSSVQLSSPDSTISTSFTVMGQTVNFSYDFSQHASVFSMMGNIIFAIACFIALKIALVE